MRELGIGFVLGWVASLVFYKWAYWHKVRRLAELWERQQDWRAECRAAGIDPSRKGGQDGQL